MFLELLDLAAKNRCDIDNERIQQQDEKCQLPVHPEQDGRCADNAQHSDNESADADTDKVIDGLQVGDEV